MATILTVGTAAAYWIGFDPKADPAQSNHPTPRIIFPTCSTHYVARAIDPTTPSNFAKMNNKGGKPAIFNAKILQDSSTETIFVTEGGFDALSIIEAGAAADKQKAADIRKFCFDVLSYYKAEKIITDYEKQTKGRSITGIIIDL